ncbi:O-spanin [Burkholderia phage vB_BglM_WTB]
MDRVKAGRALAATIVVVTFIALLVAISGCTTLSDRYSSAHVRHPCGNVWNVCPGDSPFWDAARKLSLGGQ